MTKKHSTKRALLSSVLVLLLCLSTFVGTTFAWFTDSVTSANNIIQSGKLDVKLYHSDAVVADEEVDANTILFDDVTLWEPGVMVWEEFTVENAGNLALKYQFTLSVLEATVIDGVSFAEMLKVAVVDAGFDYTRENVEALTEWSSLATFISDGELAAGNTEGFGIVIWWQPSDIDNDFNMNNGATDTVSVKVGVNLFATQLSAESDAFGSDYDADAPIVSAPVVLPETGAVVVTGDKDVKVALPEAIVDALPAGVEEIALAVSEPVVEGNTVTFAAIEVVDQNGNIIDLANLGANANITVTLPLPEGATFAEGEEVMIYHDGAYVATAIVTGGVISYEVAHLCEVSVGVIEEPVVNGDTVEIANVAQLLAFANIVNSGKDSYAGKTVVLTADIDLNNVAWTPVGNWDYTFDGNFNGQGHKIMNLNMSDDTAANDYAYLGFFGITANNTIENVVFENVTVNSNGQIVAAAIAYPYYTTVKNITVCGDIAINGGNYTAGVLAYTRHCIVASNLTVDGNDGSYITGAQVVGGVISDIQINGAYTADYSNFSASNLTITGTKMVGGISGIICKQTLNGATVENVELVCSDARVGIISGCVDSKPAINNAKYSKVTGTTSIVGASYDSASKAYVVIDGVECAANAAAFKEQLETGTVNLASDIVLDETIVIPSGAKVVINLNGCTITGTMDGTGNKELFLVKGDLAVENGAITFTVTKNQEWSAMATIFDVTAGGVLNLEAVNAKVSGTDMNFIVHLNNWGSATAIINNCDFELSYVAVRAFNSGYDMNTVTIKNTDVVGGARLFWVHNYTSEGAGDSTLTLDIYNNNNTSEHATPVRFGFSNSIFFDLAGNEIQ